MVVAGGTVCGTWTLDGDTARVSWFAETGSPARRQLGTDVERLGSILGRPLELEIDRT